MPPVPQTRGTMTYTYQFIKETCKPRPGGILFWKYSVACWKVGPRILKKKYPFAEDGNLHARVHCIVGPSCVLSRMGGFRSSVVTHAFVKKDSFILPGLGFLAWGVHTFAARL